MYLVNLQRYRGFVSLLSEVVGAKWLQISGQSMDTAEFAWEEIVITTSGKSIRVINNLTEMDFGDGLDEYSVLEVVDGAGSNADYEADGFLYIHGKNQFIKSVWILSGTLEYSNKEGETLAFELLDGFAFQLEDVWICVRKGSQTSQSLTVSRASSLEDLDTGDLGSVWQDLEGGSFKYSSQWLSV